MGRVSSFSRIFLHNGYQESLKMSPFEALYDKKCNTPINWNDPLAKVFLGHDMLKEME